MPDAGESSAVRWLHAGYRTGAAVDALATLSWLAAGRLPEPAPLRMRFRRDSPELAYGLRSGAALMAGWTGLLLWADRRPIERRGVLALTVVPVVAGLMAADAAAERAGHLPRARVVPIRTLQLGLAGLFAVGWSKGTRQARQV